MENSLLIISAVVFLVLGLILYFFKQNKKDRASARGNLTKELMKKGMSWRVFMKAMVFLGLRKFDIIIVATHGNGKVTQHMKTVNLGSMVPYPTEESSQDDDIRNGDNDNTLV